LSGKKIQVILCKHTFLRGTEGILRHISFHHEGHEEYEEDLRSAERTPLHALNWSGIFNPDFAVKQCKNLGSIKTSTLQPLRKTGYTQILRLR
jgi:hypothetical protein